MQFSHSIIQDWKNNMAYQKENCVPSFPKKTNLISDLNYYFTRLALYPQSPTPQQRGSRLQREHKTNA